MLTTLGHITNQTVSMLVRNIGKQGGMCLHDISCKVKNGKDVVDQNGTAATLAKVIQIKPL